MSMIETNVKMAGLPAKKRNLRRGSFMVLAISAPQPRTSEAKTTQVIFRDFMTFSFGKNSPRIT
jgi:hypothetical protein